MTSGCKWLLNVAHMTLGEYPAKVDPRYLLDLDGFLYSGQSIGKFRDVGHLLGVNRLNQAGGAIMDDFDGDCAAGYRRHHDGSGRGDGDLPQHGRRNV